MITHPEKVLFPDDGITKGEVAAYYDAMAPVILTHLRGRPITMERYPGGIGTKGFWQKDGVVHHPVVTGTAAVDHQPEHDHAARVGVTPARPEPPRPVRVRSRPVG